MAALSPSRSVRTALWIARRYLFARGHGYATFINWVSFVGLALGVAILTVVISVMNGFDREITTRILAAVPHAVALGYGERQLAPALAIDGVRGAGRYFQAEAMLTRRGGTDFIVLSAVSPQSIPALGALASEETWARLQARPGGLLLGAPLADARGIAPGETVVLVVAAPTPSGVRPRIERFELAGTFEVGADPDATLAFVMRDDIARRGLASAGIDGWRLHLDDPLAAPLLAPRIRAALGERPGAAVRFWMDDYGALFRAVKVEKAIMFALLALIVAIAAFNMVSGQAMLVNDKTRDVAMLATMGASRRLLAIVFFLQGFAVAVLGVATGLGAGVAIAVNADAAAALVASVSGASIIEGTWFASIPSDVQAGDLVAIAALSLGLSLCAVLAPALKATAANPAESLHSL